MDATLAHLLLEVKNGDSDALIIAVDYSETIGSYELAKRLDDMDVTTRDYIEAYAFLYGEEVAKVMTVNEKEFCNHVRNRCTTPHFMDYLEATLAVEINPTKMELFRLIKDPIYFQYTLGDPAIQSFCRYLKQQDQWWRMPEPWRTQVLKKRELCHWLSVYTHRAAWSLVLKLRSKHLEYY